MEDRELLALLRREPERGMAVLTAQYGPLVYAVCKGRLLPGGFCPADVEGCAADTLGEFYLELNRYDPEKGSLRAWLCVMARHNALDLIRRRPKLLPLSDEIPDGTPLDSALEEQELRRVVLEEVKALGEPDREILLRKYYLGESSKEIAARLGMTVSNVDTRTSRAVEKLRSKLKDWRE